MERNITLDYFKFFLSILVITIHFKIPIESNLDSFYDIFIREGIAKLAVPTFFIINGYFLRIDSFQRIKKYIIHIGTLYIVWSLFYLPCFDLYNLRLFIFNVLFGYYHLWYLPALIYSVILYYIINKIIKNNFALLSIAIVLFVIGYVFEIRRPETTPLALTIYKLNYFYFLFIGLPFLMIGNVIKSAMNKVISKVNVYFVICSITIFIVEIYYKVQYNQDIYLSLLGVCPILFLYVLKQSKYSSNTSNINHLSSAIYFVHPFIIRISTNLYPSNIYLLPFIILLSILISFLIIYANKSLKIFL